MKRILSIVMAGIILGFFAVNSMALDMSAGVKGGLAMANLTGKDATPPRGGEKKILLGANAGGVFNINFAPMFGAELDLFYSMKGAHGVVGAVADNLKYDYLDIPLLAKFTVPMEGAIKPVVYAGPSFSILLSAKEEISGTGTMDGTTDVKDGMNSLDIGLVAGVGAEIGAGPGKVLVDARYSMGFTTTEKLTDADKAVGKTEAPVVKNSVFSFMAGYAFKF